MVAVLIPNDYGRSPRQAAHLAPYGERCLKEARMNTMDKSVWVIHP